MDGDTYQPLRNVNYPLYSGDLANGAASEIMPPIAPAYKHSSWPAERSDYTVYQSEQQALKLLRDNAYESHIEDMRVVQDAIEIRVRILPKPAIQPENSYYSCNLNSNYYKQPIYSYPYQYLNQVRSPAPYQYPVQYNPQYQPLYQYPIQYNPQYQYQYSNQLASRYFYQYPYQYPNQFSSQYLYQYPAANVVRGIVGAISQIEFAANLLRR